MSELFPNPEPAVITVMTPGMMGRGWSPDVPLQIAVWSCMRCSAVVSNTEQHTRWHGVVDSNATADLGGVSDHVHP